MAYGEGKHLKYETASKIGHVSVIEDEFIQEIVKKFELIKDEPEDSEEPQYTGSVDSNIESSISSIISVDGSFSLIQNSFDEKKIIAYIKIAAMIMDLKTLAEANKPIVDPNVLNDILTKHSDTYSTVIPINNIAVKGYSLLESFRKIADITLKKYENGVLYDTLKYLVYREWHEENIKLEFHCPVCYNKIVFERGTEHKKCEHCNSEVLLSDYLGFSMDVNEDNNNEALASNFMLVLEHLLLFSYIKELFQHNKEALANVLFIKDGPLALYSQYTRIIEPIRAFLEYMKTQNIKFNIVGIEKSGTFIEHSKVIDRRLINIGDYFIPDNKYIFSHIKYGSYLETKYNERVAYGSKLFLKIENGETIVIMVPTGNYCLNPKKEDLIGLDDIIKTLLKLKSRQFSGALLPIVAINKIASMSVYPSNNLLKKFTEEMMGETL